MTTTLNDNQSLVDYELDAGQLEAVKLCLDLSATNRIACINGSAGTGKTTILRVVYNELVAMGYDVTLVAPTGKAAKRIKDATGIPACTAHKLLEYSDPGEPNPKTGKPYGYSFPKRTSSNRLECDVILFDEGSMLVQEIMRNLFSAMKPGSFIRFFGDMNQLPPIEGKSSEAPVTPAFATLLEKHNKVTLTTVHRQKENLILDNLHKILKGQMPIKNAQWDIIRTDYPVDALRKLILEFKERGIDFASDQAQIITQQNNSWIGTIKLNRMVQELLNSDNIINSYQIPRNPWIEGDGGEKGGWLNVSIGDKLINTKNNHDLGLMNGETGTLIAIDFTEGTLTIDFGDRVLDIPAQQEIVIDSKRIIKDPRKDLDLGYVLTTHKMQGSECDHVVYMMNKSTAYMQRRSNFYTACSRAKKSVTLITDADSIIKHSLMVKK